jgi:uncharacterized protein (TIGR00730 family)
MSGIRRICVYCGANVGARPAYAEAARRLGRVLGERGLGLVYGGGNVGLMGVLADAALAAGAEVIGVIPRALVARELGHQGITELRVVETMHERKAVLAELADAFVALPGGLGTLDELFEAMTWAQLGLHQKPIGLLEVDGFFAPLVAYLDRAVTEGFVRAEHRAALTVASEPEELLERFATYRLPNVGKWLGRDIRLA